MASNFHNQNSSNSGVQIGGSVGGSVHNSRTGEAQIFADLDVDIGAIRTEMRHLRAALSAAIERGAVSRADADDAEETIREVNREIESEQPDTGRLRRSMKSILGSVLGAPELAELVGALLKHIGHG